MVRGINYIFLLTVFVISSAFAEWIPLKNSSPAKQTPEAALISDNDSETVIRFDLSGFDVSEMDKNGETFHQVDLLNDIFTIKPGEPEIPYLARILAIPEDVSLSVEIVEMEEPVIFKGYNLPPARMSWKEGDPEPPYIKNKTVYSSEKNYPGEMAAVEAPVIFRDFRLARIAVYPVKYIPAKNELQVIPSITIRVRYHHGETVNPKTTAQKHIAPSFAPLYRSLIFNYDDVLRRKFNGTEDGRDVLLCFVPDAFLNSFQSYAAWKHKTGTEVHVVSFSSIGATAGNPQIIKDYISGVYSSWEYPPTYVLLVGDKDVAPVKYITYDYTFTYENFFVEVEGDDFFPEMMIGRITNQSDYQLRVMINKFITYEKSPYVADPDWFKKGICCSNNYYDSQIKTKRFTARVMEEDGGFTVDTLMSDAGCTMNLSDVTNAINEGRSYLNYRGEGWTTGWWASCYPFNVSNVTNLNNGQKLTFVTSIGCGVAMFDNNCFGEAWLELGSVDAPRGAIAFVGPTSNTHTTYNNRIDKGIYVGMFREGMETPGQALLRGKLYMYNVFGVNSGGDINWVEYHYRVFCVLGDPSIHIWKDVPKNVVVTHNDAAAIGYNQVEVLVKHAAHSTPVEGATVVLSGDNVYVTGKTDADGYVFLEIAPETEQTLDILVRGQTVIPYEGFIEVSPAETHVSPFGGAQVSDLDGNVDGLINPGENGQIAFILKNWGSQTALNVQAEIDVSDTTNIRVLSADPVLYGNVAAGATQEGASVNFYVKPHCPVEYKLPFTLHISSETEEWNYRYYYDVKGCKLRYEEFYVDDTDQETVNHRMDPGETVKLYLSVSNIGEEEAPGVHAVLRINDPYFTLVDSTAFYGDIDMGEEVSNTSDSYTVTIDPACTIGYNGSFELYLMTEGGRYEYETTRYFSIPVGVAEPTDPTGPDDYGYYAYASDDSSFSISPVYDWFELNGLGTAISVPANESEYTETVDLPFSFQYYGNSFNQIRLSTDGWVAFGSGTQTGWRNYPLPHNDNITNMAAIFWDDLFAENGSETGTVLYYHDAASHRFIVEWLGVGHYSAYDDRETFQLILLDPDYYPTLTGDGELIMQYNTVIEAGGNTIGLENGSQTIGLVYVHDDTYVETASRLKDHYAIKFSTNTPIIVDLDDPNSPDNSVAGSFLLEQNYPNPFNPVTFITYQLPVSEFAALKIYNVKGQLIKTLKNSRQTAGKYTVSWDATNDKGERVGSGIYFYRLQAGDHVQSKKLILIK